MNRMTSDMRFVGIFTIIYGAIRCLGIITAIIGIPLIIAGLRLREAADEFDAFGTSGDQGLLEAAFDRQRSFFYIYKILIIVGLVFMALYIVGMILFMGTMMAMFGDVANM